MTEPHFSILIAQYNNGRFFKDCYDSIMAQTYQNWEVIIVDDASTDDSLRVMQNIIGQDARFRICSNEENLGCGYTKRRLAELAQGELCAFLDPDDAITPEALKMMVAEHNRHPGAAAVYSKPYFCDGDLNIDYERPSEQVVNGDQYFFDFEGRIFAFMSYKKSFYDKTEGISAYLQRAVDKDLVLKLYETGPCMLLDRAMYKYRIHGSGISMSGNEDKAYFWFWMVIMDAAKRRNVNVEDLYIKYSRSRREISLEKEVACYNSSMVFKILRKLGLFKIW